jgi:hypothetical protein
MPVTARTTARTAPRRLRTGLAAAALTVAALAGAMAVPASASATTASASEVDLCDPGVGDACVLDARTGAHPDYDRLVFDMDGPGATLTTAPSADGEYVTGEGDPRYPEIKADSYLIVTMNHALGYDYATPRVDDVGLPSLKGLQFVGGVEGTLQFVLSLGPHTSVVTSHLTGPERLIVDVYH